MLITHSMGACLVMKYIAKTGDNRKTIMCMPFISTSRVMHFASYIPMIQYCYIPKCCLIPNHTIFEGGNLLNDDITLVRCSQVYQAITEMFLSDGDLVRVVNSHKNLRIIYADNEQVSPITSEILSQIRGKISFSKGKHVSFANVIHMSDFFDVLTSQIKKLE